MKKNSNQKIGEQKHKKRMKQLYVIMGLSALLGAPFGFMFGRLAKGTLSINNISLSVLLFLLTIAFFYLTWMWYKNMDEFERTAFHESGNIAFHAGFIAIPWYILHKQGILPALDSAYLMCGMSVIFCVSLIFKKGIAYK